VTEEGDGAEELRGRVLGKPVVGGGEGGAGGGQGLPVCAGGVGELEGFGRFWGAGGAWERRGGRRLGGGEGVVNASSICASFVSRAGFVRSFERRRRERVPVLMVRKDVNCGRIGARNCGRSDRMH
jgi:hypothetical protein